MKMSEKKVSPSTISGTFTVNAENWTGKEITVNVKGGKFELYDYKFEIADINEICLEFTTGRVDNDGWFKLATKDSGSDTIHFEGKATAERIVRAAVVFIANRY